MSSITVWLLPDGSDNLVWVAACLKEYEDIKESVDKQLRDFFPAEYMEAQCVNNQTKLGTWNEVLHAKSGRYNFLFDVAQSKVLVRAVDAARLIDKQQWPQFTAVYCAAKPRVAVIGFGADDADRETAWRVAMRLRIIHGEPIGLGIDVPSELPRETTLGVKKVLIRTITEQEIQSSGTQIAPKAGLKRNLATVPKHPPPKKQCVSQSCVTQQQPTALQQQSKEPL